MTQDNPKATRLVSDYASALVRSMLVVSESLWDLDHTTSKGTLRELLVSSLLRRFLSSQFSVSSGVIVNQGGEQSNQMDVIILDNRVLPPFIYEQNLGVIPVESVVAVIEVKSRLDDCEVKKADNAAGRLKAISRESMLGRDSSPPFACVFGFYRGSGLTDLCNAQNGRAWLEANVRHLDAVALVAQYSWIHMRDEKTKEGDWRAGLAVPKSDAYEETKRFFAVLLDNCRTAAEKRWRTLTEHRDWFSQYIRDQGALPRASTDVPKDQGAESPKQLTSSQGTPAASSLIVPPNTKVDYAGGCGRA